MTAAPGTAGAPNPSWPPDPPTNKPSGRGWWAAAKRLPRGVESWLATPVRFPGIGPAPRWEFVVPALLSLVCLLWLAPFGTYLYGQDSVNFLFPFNANNNPLLQHNSIFSWTFPIPDETPHFYADALNWGLAVLVPADGVRERVLIWAGTFLAVVGIWRLLRTLNRLNARSADSFRFPRTVATLAYVMNPFSLSVSWWHFEGWSYFAIFLPFLLNLLLRLQSERKVPVREFAGVVVLGILLAPGEAGGFAAPIAYAVAVFFGVILWQLRDPTRSRASVLIRAGATLSLIVLLLGWTLLPYVTLPSPALTSSGYVTTENLDVLFVSQSNYYTMFNIVRMLGFTWIYTVPGAYPWSAGLAVLAVGGILVALIVLVGALLIPRTRGLGMLYLLTLPVLALASASNPPFGPLNTWLLHRGGPFLILVNAYYFVLEFYTVAFAAAIYALLSAFPWSTALSAPRGALERSSAPAYPTSEPMDAARARVPRAFLARRVADPLPLLALAAVVVFAGATWFPFLGGSVYQPSGGNIDRFEIPAGYYALRDNLGGGHSDPQFYALALPASSINGIPLDFGGSRLLDSSNLLSNFVPEPLLSANNSDFTAALFDFIEGSHSRFPSTALAAEHIRHVIVDPFVDPTSPFVVRLPNGDNVNMSLEVQALNDSLGAPFNVGGFLVYNVSDPTPIVSAQRALIVTSTANMSSYLDLLGSVNAANSSLGAALESSTWSSSPPGGTMVVSLVPYDGASFSRLVPRGFDVYSLDTNGTIAPTPGFPVGVQFDPGSSRLTVTDAFAANLSGPGGVSTNMARSGAGYVSQLGSTQGLLLNSPIGGPAFLTCDFSLRGQPGRNWWNLAIENGSYQAVIQVFGDLQGATYNLGLTDYYNGAPFAWDNFALPSVFANQSLRLNATFGPASLSASLLGTSSTPLAVGTLWFGGAAEVTRNQGWDLAAMPPSSGRLPPVQIAIQSVNASVSLGNLTVYHALPIEGILESSSGPPPSLGGVSSSMSSHGDWSVRFTPDDGSSTYTVLAGYSRSSLWSATATTGTVTTLAVNPDTNVFVIHNVAAGHPETVALSFRVQLDLGVYGSGAELVAVPAIAAFVTWRRRA